MVRARKWVDIKSPGILRLLRPVILNVKMDGWFKINFYLFIRFIQPLISHI